jgi:hypothetical protein
MKKLLMFLFLMFIVSPVWSGYYIDFATGLDANAGTKVSPWKHYGGMLGSTGNANAFSHASGVADTFFFKGGVTWDQTCFPMTIDTQGTYDRSNYTFTVDSTWYTGGSFSRPTFDCQKKVFPAAFGVIAGRYKHLFMMVILLDLIFMDVIVYILQII